MGIVRKSMGEVKIRRLGIFCFFDKDGIADDYVEYLLGDLAKNLEKLIVVVNGYVNHDGLRMFERYADQVVLRENKGFDAGAYHHAIVNVLGELKIGEWDEIVLCNDTFYGPFVPLKKIFQAMDGKEIDFWGLDYRKGQFLSFIQSYFLVFRKGIIENGDLFRYMKEYIDPLETDISDVYAAFEVGLFSYLTGRGYRYGTYVYTGNYDVYYNADRCIDEYDLPILKKKCFSPKYFSRETLIRALYFVDKKFSYDIRYVIDSVSRSYGFQISCESVFSDGSAFEKSLERKVPDLIVDEETLLTFMRQHQEFYIYGTGIVAKKIWHLFRQQMDHLKGFVISDDQESEKETLFAHPIEKYSKISPGSALILGIDFKNSKEVIPGLRKEDEVLALWEGLEIGGISSI